MINLLVTHLCVFVLLIGILGLLVGSFLNMACYRLPIMLQRSWRKECLEFLELPAEAATETFNFCVPRSHCPHCKQLIRWWQNIPVFSYLFLRAKCAHCHQAISIRYFLLEISCAFFSVIVAWHFGVSWQTALGLVFTWSLLALIYIDIEQQLLPDIITLLLLWLGLLVSIVPLFSTCQSAIIGAAAGYVALWLLSFLFTKITGKIGMGHGDFKLCAALGAWLGWEYLPFVLLLSSLVGAVVGIIFLLVKKKNKNTPIPFGPFLALAGWVMLLWGSSWVSSYWAFMG